MKAAVLALAAMSFAKAATVARAETLRSQLRPEARQEITSGVRDQGLKRKLEGMGAQGKHRDDDFELDKHSNRNKSVSGNVLPLDQNIHQIEAALNKAERECVEAKARRQNKSDCPKKP